MATVRLTEKTLATIVPPPGAKQIIARDEELPGFLVVVGLKAKTFMYDYRVAKVRRMVTIGRHGDIMPDGREPWNVARARQRARELVGQVAAGHDPGAGGARRAGGPTLRDGLTLHVDNLRKRRKSERTIETYEGDLKRHLDAWLDRPIAELGALELDALHKSIRAAAVKRARKRGIPAGQANAPGEALANRIIRHVGAIWSTLDKLHELPGRNPRRSVVQNELAPRSTRINEGEFAAWWATVQALPNPVRRDLYTLGLFTGIRSDGIRHLRWDDLDEKAGTLHVARSKGDKPYTIPLGPRMLELLRARRADNAERFEKHGGDGGLVLPGFTRARERVGRELRRRVVPMPGARDRDKATGRRAGVALHDLRRTFNSVAIEIGIPPEARAMLMNHERRGVNLRHYGVPRDWSFLAECQAKIEEALFARIARRPGAH